MQNERNLESCKICLHRKLDLKKRLLCDLTNDQPKFVGDCPNFDLDKEKEQLVLQRKLVATENDVADNPYVFEKHKRNGAMYFWIGLFIVFTMHAIFAPLGVFVIAYGIVIYGITQYHKGLSQEKLFKNQQNKKDL